MIQRYDYEEYSVGMHKDSEHGEYVLVSDVLALLDYQYPAEDMTIYLNVAIHRERARLRAALGEK